jgi:hypothetical protein
MAFYHGDGDLELSDNVSALEKRYAGKKKGENDVRIFPVHVPRGSEDESLKLLKSLKNYEFLKSTADNGLYLIIHAGPTQSNPKAPILAEIVGSIFKEGIKCRKINLAGCHTGGKKLSTVEKSVLSEFCKTLTKQCDPALLEGTSVCAYQTEVTTFDEESEHLQSLKSEGYKVPEGMQGTHNVIQDRRGQELRATHPSVTEENIKKLRDVHKEKYGKIPDSRPLKKILKGKAVQELSNDGQRDYYKAYGAQMGAVDGKNGRYKEQALQDLVQGFELYIRTKLVAVFDLKQKEFVPGSIAQYSDNEDSRQMVTFIESFKGPTKLVFNL